MEIWKDIRGYDGIYQVSNYGNVRKGEKIMIPSTRRDGRKQVVLSHQNKRSTRKVHRLVAEAFIPNPKGYAEINHKDENPSNNNVENLEWCDRMYNQHYGTAIKRMSNAMTGKFIGDSSVLSKKLYQFTVDGKFVAEWESLYEVKRQLNINPHNISSCCNGNRKTAGGFRWSHKKPSKEGFIAK